jgi:hypothetical protein
MKMMRLRDMALWTPTDPSVAYAAARDWRYREGRLFARLIIKRAYKSKPSSFQGRMERLGSSSMAKRDS